MFSFEVELPGTGPSPELMPGPGPGRSSLARLATCSSSGAPDGAFTTLVMYGVAVAGGELDRRCPAEESDKEAQLYAPRIAYLDKESLPGGRTARGLNGGMATGCAVGRGGMVLAVFGTLNESYSLLTCSAIPPISLARSRLNYW